MSTIYNPCIYPWANLHLHLNSHDDRSLFNWKAKISHHFDYCTAHSLRVSWPIDLCFAQRVGHANKDRPKLNSESRATLHRSDYGSRRRRKQDKVLLHVVRKRLPPFLSVFAQVGSEPVPPYFRLQNPTTRTARCKSHTYPCASHGKLNKSSACTGFA